MRRWTRRRRRSRSRRNAIGRAGILGTRVGAAARVTSSSFVANRGEALGCDDTQITAARLCERISRRLSTARGQGARPCRWLNGTVRTLDAAVPAGGAEVARAGRGRRGCGGAALRRGGGAGRRYRARLDRGRADRTVLSRTRCQRAAACTRPPPARVCPKLVSNAGQRADVVAGGRKVLVHHVGAVEARRLLQHVVSLGEAVFQQ